MRGGLDERVRNVKVSLLNARRMLRARRGRGVERQEAEVGRMRGEIKEAKELKRFLSDKSM